MKAKTERNAAMLFDYLYNDMNKAAIADKYHLRQPRAWRILKREYERYLTNKDEYEKHFMNLKK